jgi:Serine hydrolase (FSH1)
MLHGYTQSGPLFRSKTRALEKTLSKAFPSSTLIYLTGPHQLLPADIPRWDVLQPYASASTSAERASEQAQALQEEPDAWAWWRRKGDREPYVLEGIEQGFAVIAEALKKEGQVDAVMGFSQGAAMAAMVAAVLEGERLEARERYVERIARQDKNLKVWEYPKSFLKENGEPIHGPLRFAVSYSGFASQHPEYGWIYDPKIKTPMLHFIGSLDTVVEEKRSLSLVDVCETKRVVYHPGGHFVPASQKEFVGALVGFIREINADSANKLKGKDEEDLDLPFGEGRL